MIVPALVIGGLLLIAAAARRSLDDGEPAPPIPLPQLPPEAPGATAMPTKTIDEGEVEALARAIASEAGSGTDAEMRAIGWTVRNRFRSKSIRAVEFPWRSQRSSDPPFASTHPATNKTTALARKILAAPATDDPTGGATAFFEPKMQDVFAKAGAMARAGETGDRVIDGVKLTDITRFKNYKKNANDIRASWSKGSALYATAGRFEFWGSAAAFARRGGSVQVIAGAEKFDDIVDPLDAIKPGVRIANKFVV